MQCVVLAGGLGTRISDFADGKPKALIGINDIPFLEIKLNQLRTEGVEEVVLAVAHMGDQIIDFIESYRKRWFPKGMNIICEEDGEYSGTLGSLIGLRDREILHSDFLLTFGDNFLHVDHVKVLDSLRKTRSKGIMTVIKKDLVDHPGNCDLDGAKVINYSKDEAARNGWVDYGLMAFRIGALDGVWPKHSDLELLIQTLVSESQLEGFECAQPFFEIGSPAGLRQFRETSRGKFGSGGDHE